MTAQHISSMTGYADLEKQIAGMRYYFTARSVNHRTLDVSVKIPPVFSRAAHEAAESAKSVLGRGRVSISVERPGNGNGFATGEETVRAMRKMRKFLDKRGLKTRNPSISELTQFGERLAETPATQADINSFLGTVRALVERLRESRVVEGERLREFLKEAFNQAEGIVNGLAADIDQIKKGTVAAVMRRFGAESGDEVSPSVRAEVAVACAKSDVTEEMNRLKAHMAELGDLIKRGGAIGRKLDFILQEIRRESGTLTSKSVEAQLTHRAIELSLLVEQMREQAQNIE